MQWHKATPSSMDFLFQFVCLFRIFAFYTSLLIFQNWSNIIHPGWIIGPSEVLAASGETLVGHFFRYFSSSSTSFKPQKGISRIPKSQKKKDSNKKKIILGLYYIWADTGVFSKVVLGFWKFAWGPK